MTGQSHTNDECRYADILLASAAPLKWCVSEDRLQSDPKVGR